MESQTEGPLVASIPHTGLVCPGVYLQEVYLATFTNQSLFSLKIQISTSHGHLGAVGNTRPLSAPQAPLPGREGFDSVGQPVSRVPIVLVLVIIQNGAKGHPSHHTISFFCELNGVHRGLLNISHHFLCSRTLQ